MRRTYRTLNDYEMQHNAEVGLFTKASIFKFQIMKFHPDHRAQFNILALPLVF